MKKILVLAAVALMVLGGCSDRDDADTGAMVEEITIEESAGDDSGYAMDAAEEAAEAAAESEAAAEFAEMADEAAEQAAEDAQEAAEDAADAATGQ